MTNQVEVVMTAQDAQAVQAWMRARQSIETYNAALGKTDQAQAKNTKSANEYDRAAKKVLDDIMTPQERYNKKLELLNTLRKQNKLTEEQYRRAIEASRDKTVELAASTEGVYEKIAGRVAAVAGVYGSIKTGVQFWIAANRELLEQANQLGEKYDTNLRKFRVQAGLSAVQGKAAQEKILDQAEQGGNTADEASQVANAMASTGFEADQITGGGARSILKIFNAQTVAGKGEDLSKMTEAISRYLESQGLEKNAANIDMLGAKIQGLKATPLKVTDLQALAAEAAGMRGKVSVDDQLAAFGQLIGIEEGSMAATDLRNIAGRLSTASGDKSKKKALQRIGLKPADVDLVGEDLNEAIAKIDKGLQKVPEGERDSILKSLVEEKGVAAFKKMAADAGQRENLKAEMNRPGLVQQDADIFESGRAAAGRRLTLQEEREVVKRDDMGDLHKKALRNELLGSGKTAAETDLTGQVADTLRYGGLSPETATSAAAGGVAAGKNVMMDFRQYLPGGDLLRFMGIGGESFGSALQGGFNAAGRANSSVQSALGPENKKLLEEQNRLMAENNKRLEENTKATEEAGKAAKSPAPRPAKPNVNPPGKRPSEQLQQGA